MADVAVRLHPIWRVKMQKLGLDDVSPAFLPSGMRSLDPHVRAFALYGMYMGHFNLMENGLNEALVKTINVDRLRGIILTRNITFADKIYIMKCLVAMAFDKADRESHVSLLNRAKNCSEDRNMVAHSLFGPSPTSDGVEFFVVQARSELRFPTEDWSVNDVFSRVEDVRKIDNDLRRLAKEIPVRRIAQALAKKPEGLLTGQVGPLGRLFGLGASILDEGDPA